MGTQEFNWLDKLIAKWRLAKVIEWIKEGDVVMDFGCGTQAFFLKTISERISKGAGYDFGVQDSKVNKKINLFQLKKDSSNLNIDRNSYDKITLLAVLEHIEPNEVVSLFDILKKKLKNNGLIVMTTPTPIGKFVLEFMAYKLKIISEAQIRDHKKYYGKEEILSLAKELNMKVVKYSTFQLGMNSLIVFGL